MAGTKRRTLTTDDLMHRLEKPDRKRLRRVENSGSGEGSSRQFNEDQSEAETEAEDQGESDSGGSLEGDEDDVNLAYETSGTSQSQPNRFSFSRKASKPHTQLAASVSSKPPPSTFSSLGVSPPLQTALSSMSIQTPTEVQVACIPPLLAGEF
jgi:ATP-dependent RNA helicase DDX49/DBP8